MVNQRDTSIILDSNADFEQLKGSTVLITGATGRLGMYIVCSLLELNRRKHLGIKILALARSKEKISKVYSDCLDDLYVLQQDIIQPMEYEGDVDYIFHTAGQAAPMDFTDDPVGTLWGHVCGTKNVLDFAVSHHTKRILYTSTVEIYGQVDFEHDISENDMGILKHNNSRACYPEAKRLCETMLECYKVQYGIDYVGVRMSHTFGPGIALNDGRAFAEFIQCAIKGEDIVLHSDGSAERTYTYVADAVNAMFLVLLNGKESWYNVANIDNLISIRDLSNMIAELSPHSIKVRYELPEGKELLYLPFHLGVLDSSKVEKLGWKARTSLRDALKYTIEDCLENGNN